MYFTDAPTGGSLVDRWYRFFPHTLVIEAGVVMTLAFMGCMLCSFLRGKIQYFTGILFVILGSIYLILAGTDDEIMRWMGQHFSISFITTYALAASDLGLVGRVFWGGAWHFLLTAFIVVIGILGTIFLFKKNFYKWINNESLICSYKNLISLIIILAIAIIGITSKNWFAPSNMRWKRISPVVLRLIDEISYKMNASKIREDYIEGIELLGGNTNSQYPFWKSPHRDSLKALEIEKNSIENFKKKSLQEKPDIILFVIETLRGWTIDFRIEKNCKKYPNICNLAKSGLYFPNAHSVGYPSIEGFLGILTGVWSHPQFTFLSDYPNTNLRSLPSILGNAGYFREILTATEPSFDNLRPWFESWFDYSEYKSENKHDVPIANRFCELYKRRPLDKPLFFDWMSTSTHVPFSLPSEYGPSPKNLEEAYVRSLVYMDSAVGIVLNEIGKGSRAKETLFILVGDHAFANNSQHKESSYIGGVHDGYTWVPLIISGPKIESNIIEHPVSQINIAPTIIDYLGLNVSNNFVGTSLITKVYQDSIDEKFDENKFTALKKYPPVFKFRMGDIAMVTDSLTYYAHMQDSTLSSVFETSKVPDWDTSHVVEGFITGKKTRINSLELSKLTHKMRAAAYAWEYNINQNKLMPYSIK